MPEHGVGHARQPVERLGVVVDDRLVGDVARRHDQRRQARAEQVMEGRVRQHHAERRRPRRHGVRDGCRARRLRDGDTGGIA